MGAHLRCLGGLVGGDPDPVAGVAFGRRRGVGRRGSGSGSAAGGSGSGSAGSGSAVSLASSPLAGCSSLTGSSATASSSPESPSTASASVVGLGGSGWRRRPLTGDGGAHSAVPVSGSTHDRALALGPRLGGLGASVLPAGDG